MVKENNTTCCLAGRRWSFDTAKTLSGMLPRSPWPAANGFESFAIKIG
jgi:hypothetical protein